VSADVRRLGPDESELLRDLRLRALRDAPLAFGSTHAREAGRTPQQWRQWVQDATAGERQVFFVAEPAAGLANGFIDRDDPDLAHLFAMWVAPEARRGGVGRALLDAVIAWAVQRGARRLVASVTEGNDGAARLYAAAGFVPTGARTPLGHSDATTLMVELRLDGRGVARA
jgi:ribosomal protein S18 acetylase RimI-like enzyme